MGYPGVSLVPKSIRGRRVAVALIVVMVILIAIPLGLTGRGVAEASLAENRAAQATKAWIAGTGYKYVSAQVGDQTVNIVITGSGDLPSQQSLEQSLAGQLYGMKVQVHAVPSQNLEFETTAGGG